LARLKLRIALILLLGLVVMPVSYAGSNRPPQASFTYSPAAPTINDLVAFDGSGSSDPDGRIVLYEWDFDGDGSYEQSLSAAATTWLYDEPGRYRVSLRVTDNGGAVAVGAKDLEVAEAPIVVRQSITTPLGGNRALPGDWLRVTVEIGVRTQVNGLGLVAELPEGWRLRAVENGDATFKQAGNQWLWVRGLLSGDRLRIVYEVQVPGSAPRGLYKIGGLVSSFSPRFKIPIPQTIEVQVL
jgi:nitrogen fixation protein